MGQFDGTLDGRVACVTGGTRSIGRGIAEALYAAGASVVVNGRDAAKGQQCIDEMGGGDRLHFIGGDMTKQADEEWRLEIDWNLNHVFWGMRRALNHMIPRGSGRILVTSSVEGKLGKPGLPGYVATKHAVNGLVKTAAREVGTLGITVNALLPGLVETDIVKATGPASAEAMGLPSYDSMLELFTQESAIKRCNTVEEVGAVAAFLAGDAARNMTGCL